MEMTKMLCILLKFHSSARLDPKVIGVIHMDINLGSVMCERTFLPEL